MGRVHLCIRAHPYRFASHTRARALAQESIRKNFILVYELLDEMMDYGYPQGTSTETLKTFVYNEPVLVESAKPNMRCDPHSLSLDSDYHVDMQWATPLLHASSPA
jgi:hypothetical protein